MVGTTKAASGKGAAIGGVHPHGILVCGGREVGELALLREEWMPGIYGCLQCFWQLAPTLRK